MVFFFFNHNNLLPLSYKSATGLNHLKVGDMLIEKNNNQIPRREVDNDLVIRHLTFELFRSHLLSRFTFFPEKKKKKFRS